MGHTKHSIVTRVLLALLILQSLINGCIGQTNIPHNHNTQKCFNEDSSNPAIKTCCEFQNSFVNGTCHSHGTESWDKFSKLGIELKSYSNSQKFLKINASMESNSEVTFIRYDGSLEVNGIIYLHNTYCIDSMEIGNVTDDYYTVIDTIVFFIPKQDIPSNVVPLTKCCRWDEIAVKMNPLVCIYYNESMGVDFKNVTRKLYQHYYTENCTDRQTIVHTDHSPVGCEKSEINVQLDTDFRITHSGGVELAWDFSSWVQVQDYCLETFATKRADDSIKTDTAILYCPSEVYDKIGHLYKAQLIYSTVSWVFILITLVVYLILWDKHSLHGWTQFAFLISAFCYYFMKFIRKWMEISNNLHLNSSIPDRLTSFFTFGLYTNLVNLNFSMLWKFIEMRPTHAIRNSDDMKRLCVSVSICWILSALIPLTEVAMGYHFAMQLRRCALGTCLVINIVIVFATGCIICHRLERKQTTVASASFGLSIFIKLFLVTGIAWSLKIFDIFFNQNWTKDSDNWHWRFVDFITNMYGIVLFVAFAINRIFLRGFKEKFPHFFARFPALARSRSGKDNIMNNHSLSGTSSRKNSRTESSHYNFVPDDK